MMNRLNMSNKLYILLCLAAVAMYGCTKTPQNVPQTAGTVYTITFGANGGTVSLTSDTTDTNGRLTGVPTPTRSDYTFDGWFTAATGGTPVTTNTIFTANATIYAQWTAISSGGGGGFATSFVNPATGKDYKTVKIGTQTWMGENLNYETSSGSWCYDNDSSNCDKYGRLYDWATAMNIGSSYNNSTWGGSDNKHQGVCPSGWHLPSRAEWDQLANYVGGSLVAGTKLKSTSGWNDYNGSSGNGTDEYGFSALPGGYRYYSDGSFITAGDFGDWWTATEGNSGYAYYRGMGCDVDYLYDDYYDDKDSGFSVRCVVD